MFVSSPIPFSSVLINVGNSYDTVTNSFKPSKAGYFWFVFDISADLSGKVNYWMRDITTGDISSISSSRNKLSILSRSDFKHLQPSSQLQMFSEHSYSVSKEGLKGISWGGFNIDEISMNPLIAFSVIQTENMFDTIDHIIYSGRFYQQYIFNVVLVNLGQCWNATMNMFTATVRGAYIFSFSANTNNSNVLANLIILNDFSKQFESKTISLYSSQILIDGFSHTISGSEIVMLNKGDLTFLNFGLTKITLAESYRDFRQTSFRGFFYSVPHNLSVIWLARLFKESVSTSDKIFYINENKELDLIFEDISL